MFLAEIGEDAAFDVFALRLLAFAGFDGQSLSAIVEALLRIARLAIEVRERVQLRRFCPGVMRRTRVRERLFVLRDQPVQRSGLLRDGGCA